MSDHHGEEIVTEESPWRYPAIIIVLTLILSAFVAYYYLGPGLSGITGSLQNITARDISGETSNLCPWKPVAARDATSAGLAARYRRKARRDCSLRALTGLPRLREQRNVDREAVGCRYFAVRPRRVDQPA